ncbi:MAG TPA: hypothetical protein DEP23_01730 [Ruminococcaceae bacterium]|nr:hypothetical protein [Oscillospiraceae bacterium]
MRTILMTMPDLMFGAGSINQMAEYLYDVLRFKNATIVTDGFLASSGAAARVAEPMTKLGMKVDIFSEVLSNPTTSNAEACYEHLKKADSQVVLGLGGGSAMDVAKVAAALISNPPPVEKYLDKGGIVNRGLPCITIPTTAGTGAEATAGGMILNEATHVKGVVGSKLMTPVLTVIDPELQITLPPNQTAATGMDALTHAVETFTSKKESIIGDFYSSKAIELIGANLRTAYHNGNDLNARTNMALGAYFAGLSMLASSTGANHALAYGIESRARVPHGVANAILLPAVMRFNAISNIKKFKQIATVLGENIDGLSDRDAAFRAADAVAAINADINMPTLKGIGIKESDFDEMADVSVGIRRLIEPNPRSLTKEQAIEIYREIY